MISKALSYDERGLAINMIDQILRVVEKRETIPYEPELLELVYAAWIRASRSGLKEALVYVREVSGAFTQADLEATLAVLRSETGIKLAGDVKDGLIDVFGRAYLNGKALSLGEQLVDVSFTLTDERAVAWLIDHHTYWIGSYFDKQISGAIATQVSEGLAQGLGRDDVGKLLKSFFQDYPGVPVKPDTYWSGLAATAMNRTRVFSSVSGYREAGIRELQILAAMDERTCPVCEQLHGKIIPIGRAATQVAQMMATENPEDVKGIAPWLSASELADLNHEQMMNRGVILPPFHQSCRCDTVPL